MPSYYSTKSLAGRITVRKARFWHKGDPVDQRFFACVKIGKQMECDYARTPRKAIAKAMRLSAKHLDKRKGHFKGAR